MVVPKVGIHGIPPHFTMYILSALCSHNSPPVLYALLNSHTIVIVLSVRSKVIESLGTKATGACMTTCSYAEQSMTCSIIPYMYIIMHSCTHTQSEWSDGCRCGQS